MSSLLDPKVIKNVTELVYRRFPEVSGAKPNIRRQTERQKSNLGVGSDKNLNNYLLTYRGKVDLGDGKKMDRWVRVVVNCTGRILKMTTSR